MASAVPCASGGGFAAACGGVRLVVVLLASCGGANIYTHIIGHQPRDELRAAQQAQRLEAKAPFVRLEPKQFQLWLHR